MFEFFCVMEGTDGLSQESLRRISQLLSELIDAFERIKKGSQRVMRRRVEKFFIPEVHETFWITGNG